MKAPSHPLLSKVDLYNEVDGSDDFTMMFLDAVDANDEALIASALENCEGLRPSEVEWIVDLFRPSPPAPQRCVVEMRRRRVGRPTMEAGFTADNILLSALRSGDCQRVGDALAELGSLDPGQTVLLADAFRDDPELSERLPFRVFLKYPKPGRPRIPPDVKLTAQMSACGELQRLQRVDGLGRKQAVFALSETRHVSEASVRRLAQQGQRRKLPFRR